MVSIAIAMKIIIPNKSNSDILVAAIITKMDIKMTKVIAVAKK